ncbi:aldo/keto reductase [Deinococcus sp.]|uniref:aldo/keto reductase n=1 Tax=Deinococcus sp. TaxID=47478 RepID=UPI003C7BF849
MEHRQLGTSALSVSLVGLGCNNFGQRLDQEATNLVVRRALDAGVTLFDTADVYGGQGGSERMLGHALGAERANIVLATKFGHDMGAAGKGAKPEYIRKAIGDSLKRLGTDHIDLYQLHTPDASTPLEDTLGALNQLVQQGLVRFIGCSNLDAAGIRQAAQISKQHGYSAFVSAQDEYSLLVREAETELLPTLEEQHLGLLPYFPLASGLLTGKYRAGQAAPEGTRLSAKTGLTDRYMTPQNTQTTERLRAFAESKGHTLLELAFSWLAAQGVVSSVIAGATKPEQIDQNVSAVDWKLSEPELKEVGGVLNNVPA